MWARQASTSTSASASAVWRMRLASAAIADTQFGKQAALDLDDFFLGVENLRFVFFQLWSREALGIDQRLLTFVVGGREVQIRF